MLCKICKIEKPNHINPDGGSFDYCVDCKIKLLHKQDLERTRCEKCNSGVLITLHLNDGDIVKCNSCLHEIKVNFTQKNNMAIKHKLSEENKAKLASLYYAQSQCNAFVELVEQIVDEAVGKAFEVKDENGSSVPIESWDKRLNSLVKTNMEYNDYRSWLHCIRSWYEEKIDKLSATRGESNITGKEE